MSTDNEIKTLREKKGYIEKQIQKVKKTLEQIGDVEEPVKEEVQKRVKGIENVKVEVIKKEHTLRNKIFYEFFFIIGVLVLVYGYFQKMWATLVLGLIFMFVSLFIYEMSFGRHPKEKGKLLWLFRYLSLFSSCAIFLIVTYILLANSDSFLDVLKLPLEYSLAVYVLIGIFACSFFIMVIHILRAAFIFRGRGKLDKEKVVARNVVGASIRKKSLFGFSGKKETKLKIKDVKQEITPKILDVDKTKISRKYIGVFVIGLIIAGFAVVYKEWFTLIVAVIVMLAALISLHQVRKELSKSKEHRDIEEKEAKLPLARRSPFGVFFLCVVTAGIYFLFWYYSVNKEIKKHAESDKRPELYLLGMFVPILNLYCLYKTAVMVKEIEESHNDHAAINPIAALLIAILFFPFYALLIQYHLNRHLDVHTGKIKLKEVIFDRKRENIFAKHGKKISDFLKKKINKEEYQDKVPTRRVEVKPKPHETDIDILKRLLDAKGKMKISVIATYFGVTRELAEEWAKILEGHQLATLHYPAVGEPELIKWTKKQ